MRDGLYYLEPMREGVILIATDQYKDAGLWHRRLGHLPVARFPFVSNLSCTGEYEFLCDACYRAKQTQLPFQVRNNKTSLVF